MSPADRRNAASRLLAESVRLLNELDPADYESLFSAGLSDDFVRDDRRTLGTPELDGLGELRAVAAFHELGQGRPVWTIAEYLDEAGERLSMIRLTLEYESGYSLESIHVVRLDAQGRIASRTLFDVEQRTEAEAEFRRLADELDQLGPS